MFNPNHIVTRSTDSFFWHPETKQFTGEASEVPENTLSSGTIILVNPKTNGSCAFADRRVFRDRDGDVQCWKWFAHHIDAELIIFND